MRRSKSYLYNKVKDQDMFGHTIELTFNGGGSTHNTIIGGFLSIFVRAALLAYVILTFLKMYNYADNNEATANAILDMDPASNSSIEAVTYNVPY